MPSISFTDFYRDALKAVFFDFDGVIVDSETGHYEAFTEMLRSVGVVIDGEEYQREYVGHELQWNIRRALELHEKELSADRVAGLMTAKADHFGKLVSGLRVFAGVREFLEVLRDRQVPIAVISSSLRQEVEMTLAHFGFSDFFIGVVAADDLQAGERKPSPIPYQRGLKIVQVAVKAQILPETCLVIEDSGGGVRSGKAAGMRVLGVTNSLSAESLYEAGADWTVDCLDNLAASKQSPFI